MTELAGEGASGTRVLHGSVTLEVDVAAAPSEVYAAFQRADLRRRWFRVPGKPGAGHPVDLFPGASETLHAELPVGAAVERIERRLQALDLVADRRVVLTYQVLIDGRCRSVSLVTVGIDPASGGSRVTWTEQYAFLEPSDDGNDAAHLRGGVRLLLNGLAVALGAVPRPASER